MAYDEHLAARVRERLRGEPGVIEKRMFGGLGFLVRGHLAVAASRDGGLMVRVEPEQTAGLLGEPHTRPFEMRGRELLGWLRVDVDALDTDTEFEAWVDRGLAFALTLPPK
jgi:TfoX/Sxy family transcriptional regulator of competence genes